MTVNGGHYKEGLPLFISEADLDADARATLEALSKGRKIFDNSQSKEEVIAKALPSAVIRKLEAVVPKGYRLESIDMEVELKGGIGALGFGGKVTITIIPSG